MGIAFGLFSAAALFLSYEANFLRVVETKEIVGFQDDSESLVVTRLALVRDEGVFVRHGLLIRPEGMEEYLSCFGLQGTALSLLQAGFGLSPRTTIGIGYHLMTAAFSLTLALFLAGVFEEFGIGTASITLLLLAGSKWLILFARNLYWAIFLHFLPFGLAWFFYPHVVRGGLAFGRFAVLIAAAVFVKSLCGYEYITNIILSASVPVVYFDLRAGLGWRQILKRVAVLSATACVGFALALTLHLTQLTLHLDSVEEAGAAVLDRVLARTHGPSDLTLMPADATLIDAVRGYFSHVVVNLGISLQIKHLLGLFLVLPLLRRLARLSIRWPEVESEAARLYLTCGFALAATLTWVFMAKGHMYYHRHINAIVYQLPFLTTFNVFLAWMLMWVLKALTGSAEKRRVDKNSTAV